LQSIAIRILANGQKQFAHGSPNPQLIDPRRRRNRHARPGRANLGLRNSIGGVQGKPFYSVRLVREVEEESKTPPSIRVDTQSQ